MATKNNPDGTRVSMGALVEKELFDQFDELTARKCLQKTKVLRCLVSEYVQHEQFLSDVIK